ncbi:P-loop containing nucleoside triphosphate hydrolase protein [Trichoderma camerunense]
MTDNKRPASAQGGDNEQKRMRQDKLHATHGQPGPYQAQIEENDVHKASSDFKESSDASTKVSNDENSRKITKEQFKGIDREGQWLKPLLNNGSNRCIILRPEGTKALITNPKEVQLKDIDAILTLLCAAYKLMTANPKRFCQKSSGNSDEFTWGFHHEDWFRAYVAIVFTKNRRSKTTEVPEQGPMRYVGVRGIAEKSEIYGYATLDVISSTQTLEEGYYSNAAVEITKEMALLDPEHNKEAMQKLEQRASNEQIARALNAIDSIGKNPQSTRESLVENDDGILEDIISDEVANTLHATAPGIDLHRTLMSTLPKEHQRAEMTGKERQSLINLLRQTLREYKTISPHPNLSQGDQYQLQTITTAGDVTGLADESGTMGSDKDLDCQLDSLRAMRELLGENIPENQDLEQICESRGIDLATLEVNPHNPSATAKPPQIPDAHRLAELLSGKLRSAMLLSDCGTGKTFVTLLTLKFLLDDRIQAHEKGALDLLYGDRVFKPNIIFVPSATLSQFFSEVNSCWAGIFNIYSFYQSRSNCANTDRKIKTIDTLQDLQKYVNRWAKQHQDPETGRVILLTAYSTAIRRLLKRRAGKGLTRDQMDLLSSQGDAIDYDRQDEEITAIFEDPPERNDGEKGAQRIGKKTVAYIRRSEKTLTNDMWNVVVCDECHQIKNPGTRANELVRQLDREALLLVSATPLPNHVRDISGYLRVLWDPAWPFGYQQKGDATNANAFFGDLVYDSLFDESIKLEVEEPLTLNRVLHGRVKTTSQLSPRELRRAMEYKSFVEDQNGPAYLLNPNLFMEFAKNKEYGTCVSTLAVGPILKLLSVRRGMLTRMTLPNGDVTFMGKGIAGFKTETVELEHPAEVKAKLAAYINILADKLVTPTEAGPSEVLAGGYVLERAGIIFNGAVYRRLSLASTDVNNIKLTTPSIRLLQRLSDLRQGTVGEVPQRLSTTALFNTSGVAQNLDDDLEARINTLGIDESGLPEYQRRKKAWNARSNPSLAAGHEEVDQVALFDTTGGLQWNFYNTRENQKLGFPPDRVNQVRYVAWDSPKMVNALLVAAGVPTLHYMSRNSQTERDKAVEAFNDPTTPYICLVTSLQLSAFGVNLHKACHRGLILEQPISQAILLQAQGRLWRIGQKHDVHWKILYSRDSFDCYIESHNLEKYATTLAAESGIDPRIKGEARVICAFEIMRQHLGQSCSRYSRARVVWSQMDSPKLEHECLFYSALAQYFFNHPDKSDLVGKHNIKEIAKAWKIGHEITSSMVESPIPLEDGLVLESYEEADDEDTALGETTSRKEKGERHGKEALTKKAREVKLY